MKGKFVVKNRKIELKNFKKIMFKIPTIVYETFSYEPMERTYELSEKLVKAIDNLEF